ncbi:hypothetical protein KY362_01555 [Candidatus Woesearchaeota archaeon]|nr:hypothetical protein [Candidatus Woesearchaeota archaeon]
MKRKLIKQGGGGTTIYLPKKWVSDRGLSPGDEVEVAEEDGRLVIGAQKAEAAESRIEKDITGLDRTSLLQTLTALYEPGFDEIRLTFKDDSSADYTTQKKAKLSEQIVEFVSRFPGLAIVSQGTDYYQIRDITQQSGKEFDIILRRTFYLLLELDSYVKETLAAGKTEFNQGKERYHNIISFVSFCLRLLNKKQVTKEQMYNYYEVVNSLEQIALYYNHLCEDLTGAKVTSETKGYINRISEVVRLFHEFCYKVDHETLQKINRRIAKIENDLAKLDTHHKEFMIIYHFSTVLDVIDSDIKCLIALKAMQKD